MKKPSRKIPSLVAVDTGGTFTDFYWMGPDGLRLHKVLSSPDDPSRALEGGLREMGLKNNFILIHGSTVATNALLEKNGARVVLLSTAGFEDVLEIGRQNRPELYALWVKRLPALIPPKGRLGVPERISVRGKVLRKLNPRALPSLLKQVRKLKPEALAISLLNSFANPRHEKMLERGLSKLKLPISLSSTICPEFREYERSSTTVINAYVSPLMSRYLGRLSRRIRGPIRIMQSNGGALSVNEASRESVRTLLSGPAGGALGAFRAGTRAGYSKLITLDMGGTSPDMSLIDEALELTTEANIAGHPVKTPMLKIDTIGAGGGSLAWIDAGGALRVGPQSAGADPGPIAYGRGGRQLTLTDAHLYLGRLDPNFFLGGKMKLKPRGILGPLKKLASDLRLSPGQAAEGILKVANANMAAALRVLSLQRGYNPRDFTLLVFGGAGGLHGCELAAQLGISRVLVPKNPGLLSAYGMAHADWVRDYVKTVLFPSPRWGDLQKAMWALRQQALADARREGIDPRSIEWRENLDLRYQGQSYELTVDYFPNVGKRFQEAHRRQYGYLHRGIPLTVVNLRLQARVKSAVTEKSQGKRSTLVRSRAKAFSGKTYRREDLRPGDWLVGPAIVAEFSATTYVASGWKLECDALGNLIIKK